MGTDYSFSTLTWSISGVSLCRLPESGRWNTVVPIDEP